MGSIPSTLGNCRILQVLNLRSNELSGSIPMELGALGQVMLLLLSENHLTRSIPTSLGNCTSLLHLSLRSNILRGPIPMELGMLVQLQSLTLWDNRLNGSITSSLANCTQIAAIQLDLNELTGHIPTEIDRRISGLSNLGLINKHVDQRITPNSLGKLHTAPQEPFNCK